MTKSKTSKLVLSAVLAALASPAFGQYQVGTAGHASDASNRIGSGGFNDVSAAAVRAANSNNLDVWTGNVSGLNYFHGANNNLFDKNTLDVNTQTESDVLTRTSAPANSAALRLPGSPSDVPYYNSSQAVSSIPPTNFVATPGGTGYVPAPQIQPLTPDADSRLQTPNQAVPVDLLPAPGEVDMVGPVDPSGVQSLYTMSPLYGTRKNDVNDPQASFFLSQYSNYRETTPADRSRMDATAVQRMQDELNNNSISGDATADSKPAGGAPGSTDLNQGTQLQNSGLASNQIPNQTLSDTVGSQPLGGSLNSGQGTQNRMLIPAAKQSAQLQALEKKYASQKLTDKQAADQYNEQRRLLNQADAKAKNGANSPSDATAPKGLNTNPAGPGKSFTSSADLGNVTPIKPADTKPPGGAQMTRPPVLNGQESANSNQPYIITSLATGIKAKGLADLLKSAEDQMRGGNFSQAIDTYDSAEEVAPNNPFVPLGRGFAELGRSYYARADTDLNRALTTEPALLAGQYDLKGFLGADRLKFIQKDLQDISKTEKSARPLVLQAYIAHNVGDDDTAVRALDQAGARGGYAALIQAMRDAWGLPAGK